MTDVNGVFGVLDIAEVVRDGLNRPIRDLRISVTDRCNFRCTYCMPKEKFSSAHSFISIDRYLSFEEIVRIAKAFVEIGGKKIRITGGEPLLRPKLERLIERLAKLPEIIDLSLTTNGSLLTREKARNLKEAGLSRVTISLDAPDDVTFAKINDVGCGVNKIYSALENVEEVGLGPAKINMVVMAKRNEHSIIPMAKLFHGTEHILRFIEYMDVGTTNSWQSSDVISANEIVEKINTQMPIEQINPNYTGEVATRWRYVDGGGEIGVIASITQPFCSDCSRARLSPEGKLYTCLFAGNGYDLRNIVRDVDYSGELLRNIFSIIWRQRTDQYSEFRKSISTPIHKVEMSYIGG